MKRITVTENNEVVIYGSTPFYVGVMILFGVIGTICLLTLFHLGAMLDYFAMGI